MTRSPSFTRQTTSRRRHAYRPQSEGLEGRQLLSAGALDLTFGTGGFVVTSPSVEGKKTAYTEDHASTVQIQSDGKIVVAGDAFILGSGGSDDFGLVRLKTDGSLDTTFGSGGRVKTDFFYGASLNDMKLDASGKIVGIGTVQKQTSVTVGRQTTTTYDSDVGLVRYLATDGSLDPSFGSGGKVSTNVSTYATSDQYNRYDSANAMAVYPTIGSPRDGKILVVGTTKTDPGSVTTGNSSLLLRYDASGNLDPSFGQAGVVVSRLTTGGEVLYDVAIQTDGKLLASGRSTNADGSITIFVERYDADGNLDTTFGANGVAVVATNTLRYPASTSLQPDGSIVVSFSASNGVDSDVALARLTPSGALDPTFGGTGLVIVSRVGDEYAYDVAIQGDKKILVVGRHQLQGAQSDSFIARFSSDGSPDTSFGSGGFVVQSFSTTNGYDQLSALAIQPDGKIVAVGAAGVPTQGTSFQVDFVIARYQGDPVAPLSAAMALSGGTTTTSRYAATGQPEILVPLNDYDPTGLATEDVLVRTKRRRALGF